MLFKFQWLVGVCLCDDVAVHVLPAQCPSGTFVDFPLKFQHSLALDRTASRIFAPNHRLVDTLYVGTLEGVEMVGVIDLDDEAGQTTKLDRKSVV